MGRRLLGPKICYGPFFNVVVTLQWWYTLYKERPCQCHQFDRILVTFFRQNILASIHTERGTGARGGYTALHCEGEGDDTAVDVDVVIWRIFFCVCVT